MTGTGDLFQPAVLSRLAAMLGSPGGDGAPAGDPSKLLQLLGNKEVLERLSSVLRDTGVGIPPPDAPEQPVPPPREAPGPQRNARSGNRDAAFLLALKPYLSPRRAAAVDAILRFGRLEELFDAMRGTEQREE